MYIICDNKKRNKHFTLIFVSFQYLIIVCDTVIIRNKTLNYRETVSSIDTNDDITYGTGIVECDCQQHKGFVDENHGHVLTGDVRIVTNSKLRKCHEAMKQCQLTGINAKEK